MFVFDTLIHCNLSSAMHEHRLLISQIVLVITGLAVHHLVHHYLLKPFNEDLQMVLSRGFPTDYSSLVETQTLINVLRQARATTPLYVDLLFAFNYVARHLFPPFDYMLLLRLSMKYFRFSAVLIYSSDEFYLNAMAGSLYGKFTGIVICCTLTGLASLISFLVVHFVGDFLKNRSLVQREPQVLLHEEQLHPDFPLLGEDWGELGWIQLEQNFQEMNQMELLFENRPPQGPEAQEAMIQNMIDQSVPIFLISLLIVRQFPFIPTWLLSLVYANLGIPLYLIIAAMSLGYLPYAMYCTNTHLLSTDSIGDLVNLENSAILVGVCATAMMINVVDSLWSARQRALRAQMAPQDQEREFERMLEEQDEIEDEDNLLIRDDFD